MSRLYDDHGLKPGREVLRLHATRADGSTFEQLYLYGTAAYHTEDRLKMQGATVKIDYVAWDGVKEVGCDNGD